MTSPEKSVPQEAEALLEKITPGEWQAKDELVYVLQGSGRYEGKGNSYRESQENRWFAGVQGPKASDEERRAVAEFIAAAPRLVRELLAEQHRLEAENRSLRTPSAAGQAPFTGVEKYYRRLFHQIEKRREDNPPLGTGGDLDCLIAMVKWLWEWAQSALTTERQRRAQVEQALLGLIPGSATRKPCWCGVAVGAGSEHTPQCVAALKALEDSHA